MFSKMSVKITETLESKGIIQESGKEICAYGIRQILSSLLNIVTMLLIGIAMNMLLQAVIFTLAYIPVRIFAGGFHASTPQRCWAVSAIMQIIVLGILKYISESHYELLTITSLIASIIIALLSPVEDMNKPLDKKEKYVYHIKTIFLITTEITSLVIIMYFFNIGMITLTIGMVWIALCVMIIIGKIKNGIINKIARTSKE